MHIPSTFFENFPTEMDLYSPTEIYSLSFLELVGLLNSHPSLNKETVKLNVSYLRKVQVGICSGGTYYGFIHDILGRGEQFWNFINEMKKEDGSPASSYMKRDCVSALIWVIEMIEKSDNQYIQDHRLGWLQTLTAYQDARNAEIVGLSLKPKYPCLRMEVFVEMVKAYYPFGSAPRIMLLLYSEVAARDDFQLILKELPVETEGGDLVYIKEHFNDPCANFIIITRNRKENTAYVRINKSKTRSHPGSKRGGYTYILSYFLYTEIIDYIARNIGCKTHYWFFTFGGQKNSKRVQRWMRRDLKIENGSINYIRRMHTKEIYDSDGELDGDKMITKAAELGHTTFTQQRYSSTDLVQVDNKDSDHSS